MKKPPSEGIRQGGGRRADGLSPGPIKPLPPAGNQGYVGNERARLSEFKAPPTFARLSPVGVRCSIVPCQGCNIQKIILLLLQDGRK